MSVRQSSSENESGQEKGASLLCWNVAYSFASLSEVRLGYLANSDEIAQMVNRVTSRRIFTRMFEMCTLWAEDCPEINFLVLTVYQYNKRFLILKIGPIDQPRRAVRNGQPNRKFADVNKICRYKKEA